jgi:hypothetical protein
MNWKFIKYYQTVLFTLFLACSTDEIYEPIYMEEIPQELKIDALVGIKLESNFATDVINMNVKLDTEGEYFITVLDISNRIVSKEKVSGKLGDNLFRVYTSTLPKSSYRLELYRDQTKVGTTNINLR